MKTENELSKEISEASEKLLSYLKSNYDFFGYELFINYLKCEVIWFKRISKTKNELSKEISEAGKK